MTAKKSRRSIKSKIRNSGQLNKIHQAALFISEPLEGRILLSSTGLTVIAHVISSRVIRRSIPGGNRTWRLK
jgi:hypothetical protein